MALYHPARILDFSGRDIYNANLERFERGGIPQLLRVSPLLSTMRGDKSNN